MSHTTEAAHMHARQKLVANFKMNKKNNVLKFSIESRCSVKHFKYFKGEILSTAAAGLDEIFKTLSWSVMLMFSVKIDERTRKEWIKRKEREFKRRAGGFLLSPHDHRPFSFSLCFFLAILCRSFLTILIWCVRCPFTFAYSTACWNYAEKILLQLSRLQRLARKTSDTQNL